MKRLLGLAIELSREMHTLNEFIKWESRRLSERLAEEWVDSQRVMDVLNISKRTMQNLRDEGVLPFSTIQGKLYYKATDLEELLKSNYLKKGNRH